MLRAIAILTIPVLFLIISCQKKTSYGHDHTIWADSVTLHTADLMKDSSALPLHYLDSVYQTQSNPGIGDLWRKYKTKSQYYTHYDHNLEKRKMYVDSMISILNNVETQYKYEYANSLYALATLRQKERKYNQAFKLYYDGLNFAKGSIDNCTMAEFRNALGLVRYHQEEYLQAIPYLKQAFLDIDACSKPTFQYRFTLPENVLNTVALCYEKSGKLDSALYFYSKALDFILDTGPKYPERRDFTIIAQAVVEGNLGGVYAKMNQFSQAEKHLKTNIRLNNRPGFDIEDSQTASIKLGKLYLTHGFLDKTKQLLEDVGADLSSGRGKSVANGEIWGKWYDLNRQYYEKKGDWLNAYHFSQKYHTHKDSLDALVEGLKSVDLDQVFREQDHKYELSLLTKGSELKNIYMVCLAIFLAMALCIAFIIWLYYNNSKINVRSLTKLNAQMQQALLALENSQLENARLMKIVAHDLRNPIGAMSSMADMMLDDQERSKNDMEYLKLIRDSGNNSLELVNNLLHMDGSSQLSFKKENVNLADLVQHCADMLAVRAGEKQQHIRLSLTAVVLILNYEKMWRVVSNLISNAIKFSPTESIINVSIEQAGQYVQLIVKDQGIGIPEELKDKIFDSFTDSRRRGTMGEESFGLGLSISKQIVEAHGGSIEFESVNGQGTVFKIKLPVSQMSS